MWRIPYKLEFVIVKLNVSAMRIDYCRWQSHLHGHCHFTNCNIRFLEFKSPSVELVRVYITTDYARMRSKLE